MGGAVFLRALSAFPLPTLPPPYLTGERMHLYTTTRALTTTLALQEQCAPHHPLLRIGAEVALRWAVVFRSQEVGV